jgi:hypothetical protein
MLRFAGAPPLPEVGPTPSSSSSIAAAVSAKVAAAAAAEKDFIAMYDRLQPEQRVIFDTHVFGWAEKLFSDNPTQLLLLIEGPPGAGKSFLMLTISKFVTWLGLQNDVPANAEVVLTATPTGASATQHDKAFTIHTLLDLRIAQRLPITHKMDAMKKQFQYVRLLMIDELSVMPPNVLEVSFTFYAKYVMTLIIHIFSFSSFPPW